MADKLLFHTFLCVFLCCLADNFGRNPPKIVTKDGNLVLKAGEDGDIVFEPGQGKQVFIGGNVLNVSGAAGSKGEKQQYILLVVILLYLERDQGIQGPNGSKGEQGQVGPPGQMTSANGTVNVTDFLAKKKGDQGYQGVMGKNGSDGIQGPPGVNGTKGEPGTQGPPGPLFNTLNQTTLRCDNTNDYGLS
ncbi:hypothetical protein OS493_039391 [Desmophyllum pertusum]|uniref:Uncharacterized protein n=1 Tax=Desmophyllum pertusum TaxID=174260 RepID=A0A9W9YVA8_9CNID|nr:hypothetical protein OS493_039391 [Desmophyllum pertusum]